MYPHQSVQAACREAKLHTNASKMCPASGLPAQVLDLAQCGIGPAGAAALAAAVSHQPHLRELRLYNCYELGGGGAAALASALAGADGRPTGLEVGSRLFRLAVQLQ